MKEVYGYIRVSTAKQGEKGISLSEQKDAIQRYALLNNLHIISWFEERETAAKHGRTEFTKMMSLLRSGVASGVVIHKIDRSARNLRDWADLVDLADQGIDIFFVNESIDMGMRGGRLSADIQAVVAADFIRNLREETIKGMRGRLKQGLYPMRAPIGYLDMGGGKVKEVDPIKAPIIKELFEKYATGEHTLNTLLKYANSRGLTNVRGGSLSLNGISTILHNSFYMGVMHIQKMGESFAGIHEPIIDKKLFDRVQKTLLEKTTKGTGKHEYVFRRMFTCTNCKRSLIGEKQKGRVYYRCHLCSGVSIREDFIETAIENALLYFNLCSHEVAQVEEAKQQLLKIDKENLDTEKKALTLQLESLDSRLSKLTDAYIDEVVDKDLYLKKKNKLINEIQAIKHKLSKNSDGVSEERRTQALHLELYKTAYLSYLEGNPSEKRVLLQELTSNRSISMKNIAIELYSPYQELCEVKKASYCDPCRGWSRTLGRKNSQRESFQKKLEEWINKPLSEDIVQSSEVL